jgi:altronate dehydratase large subunit
MFTSTMSEAREPKSRGVLRMKKLYGYRRPDGSVGFRNWVLVMPAVACVNHTAELIARDSPGVVSLHHEVGCAQIGADYRQSLMTLLNTGLHPNVGAVLLVGLGCERVDPHTLAGEIASSGKRVECIVMQELGGTAPTVAAGKKIIAEMVEQLATVSREEVPPSSVVLGVECGGSDFSSSLSSNPVVGYVADAICAAGGRAVLSETTEVIGTEKILTARCASPEIASKLVERIRRMVEYSRSEDRDEIDGVAVPNNISPGNVRGGLTTIEEKSLGAISKGGYTSPIVGVVEYAERVGRDSGLWFMDSPGYDPECTTGLMACGCNLVLFTTGLGTPLGNPVTPIIKVTGNRLTAERMRGDIDIDVSAVLEDGASLESEAAAMLDALIDVANGKQTHSEELGYHDIGITRIGPRL